MWQRRQHVPHGQQERTDVEEDQRVAAAAAERNVERLVLLMVHQLVRLRVGANAVPPHLLRQKEILRCICKEHRYYCGEYALHPEDRRAEWEGNVGMTEA